MNEFPRLTPLVIAWLAEHWAEMDGFDIRVTKEGMPLCTTALQVTIWVHGYWMQRRFDMVDELERSDAEGVQHTLDHLLFACRLGPDRKTTKEQWKGMRA